MGANFSLKGLDTLIECKSFEHFLCIYIGFEHDSSATQRLKMDIPLWAIAATKLESKPPDNNTPYGTSAISLLRTAFSNDVRIDL